MFKNLICKLNDSREETQPRNQKVGNGKRSEPKCNGTYLICTVHGFKCNNQKTPPVVGFIKILENMQIESQFLSQSEYLRVGNSLTLHW